MTGKTSIYTKYMNTKNSKIKEKLWLCFDKKPSYLKGLKTIPISEVIAILSEREKLKNN